MSAHDNYLDPDRAGLNDEHEDNSVVEQAFCEHDGPGWVYITTYKHTACGPSVGFLFEYIKAVEAADAHDFPGEITVREWVYCDSLYRWGTWEDLAECGVLIRGIAVSSIVEGVDQCTHTHTIDCTIDALESAMTKDEAEQGLHATLRRLFYAAVYAVDKEAGEIWNDTHGCDTCAKHWAAYSGITVEHLRDTWDSVPVWKDCPDCDGAGIVI